MVTDTGSTKAQVLEWARELLPPTVSFVGGHPMAGKENSGIQNASPTLFQKTLYCVVPTPEASKTSMDLIVGLATTVGATQYFVDAAEHDILVGGISHLPLLVSAALVSTTTRSPSWDEMSKLASSGFLDVSRLASTDIELSRGIGQTNQAGLLRWLDGYMEVLADYRRALVEDMGGFIEELSQARDSRDKWLLGQLQTGEGKSMVEIPSAAEQMGEIFVGGRLTQLMRQQEERLREREKGPNDRA